MTTAQHCCDVVHLINARREKITVTNDDADPAIQPRELAEAAREWFSEDEARACVNNAVTLWHEANIARFGRHTDAPFWTDENAPVVNLDPPPQWAARRRQMRRDGLHVIAGMIGLVALIGFALTPDSAAVKSMMEASQ